MLAFQNMFYVFVNIKLGSVYRKHRTLRVRLYIGAKVKVKETSLPDGFIENPI